jgi:hypothetical protein
MLNLPEDMVCGECVECKAKVPDPISPRRVFHHFWMSDTTNLVLLTPLRLRELQLPKLRPCSVGSLQISFQSTHRAERLTFISSTTAADAPAARRK